VIALSRRRSRGFGLIEILIVLVIGALIFLFLNGYFKKQQGTVSPSYDKVYNDAKKQLEKVNAQRE
jgi:prepilin-type N-terminal cleavage/methylation domain-containing protein